MNFVVLLTSPKEFVALLKSYTNFVVLKISLVAIIGTSYILLLTKI